MEQWKQLIANAESCHSEGKTEQAIQLYELAKQYAEQLLDNHSSFDEALAALVVSYHNLSELYTEQDQRDKARKEMQLINKKVREIFAATPKDSDKIAVIQSALQRTHFALLHEDEVTSILRDRHRERVELEHNSREAYVYDAHNLPPTKH